MIKYVNNNIKKWYDSESSIKKAYYQDHVCYQSYTSGSTPPVETFVSLTDLKTTHTTASTSDGYTLMPIVSGITKIRFDATYSSSTGSYCYCEFASDTDSSKTLAIPHNINTSSKILISGGVNVKNATLQSNANDASVESVYWIDDHTIEMDCIKAYGSTVYLKQCQKNLSLSFYNVCT